MTEQQDNAPRLYLHPDGKVLSIGFGNTADTLLFLDRTGSEYGSDDADRGDMLCLRQWAEAMDPAKQGERWLTLAAELDAEAEKYDGGLTDGLRMGAQRIRELFGTESRP